MTDHHTFAFTFVPLDFAAHDDRRMHSTLAHELGHTLGLDDLYDLPEQRADASAVPEDTNGLRDGYVRDLRTGTVTRAPLVAPTPPDGGP